MRGTTYEIPIRDGSKISYVVVLVCHYISVRHHGVSDTTVCEVFAVAIFDAVGNLSKHLLNGSHNFQNIRLAACDLDVVDVLACHSSEFSAVVLDFKLPIKGGRHQP